MTKLTLQQAVDADREARLAYRGHQAHINAEFYGSALRRVSDQSETHLRELLKAQHEAHAELKRAIRREFRAHCRDHGEGSTYAVLCAEVANELEALGYEKTTGRNYGLRSWTEDVVKDIVTLARCRKHGGPHNRPAYFWLKNAGRRVYDTRCPHCGAGLDQTSLALCTPFLYIPE